ncbi:hypothetical protein NAF17_00515 [Mucilaginibacter sp. RB4R14]|uniref:hypothetical protein n=1 Tax=Mucilaginibacter aurantiaciroseus TaxID=2949308 RepID=UPI002091157C|nr:hypothetical protein [Mucilaginibacter aurantiaciroseus]MCO5934006.1 hypothetical protein [Mucilaginibacter aurantiaciroseus]
MARIKVKTSTEPNGLIEDNPGDVILNADQQWVVLPDGFLLLNLAGGRMEKMNKSKEKNSE